MALDKRRIDVMVSSTTKDLGEHRRRLGEVVSRLKMVPRLMDLDSITGKEGLDYSLGLVDDVPVYILLLGFRYGHVPDDERNPDRLSMTHLEYRRALDQDLRLKAPQQALTDPPRRPWTAVCLQGLHRPAEGRLRRDQHGGSLRAG